ncbi:hypothetical protein ACFVSU_01950 [Microbacterium sp. NPDC058062]|uniref:hypothetical protein n=1 Tax=Microbacterium sp. NPDC058062 TaxID=3346320 RepID=UPI0036D991CB
MLFARGLDLPIELEFEVVGMDAGSGTGQLVADGDRVLLDTGYRFSFSTGRSPARSLQGRAGDKPVALVGSVWVSSSGAGLLISELRVGSDELQPRYTAVRAYFEHGGLAAAYRFEDGAARSRDTPMSLPALESARAMKLVYPDTAGAATIQSNTPAALEEFEIHLAALQDLLSVAEDTPIERLRLEATGTAGSVVVIHGRNRFPPFNKPMRKPIEFLLRLGAEYSPTVIDRWWRARAELRPVPQILAGILYQPGYVESTVIALAAIAQRTARAQLSVPHANSFRQGLQAIVDYLGSGVIAAAKVDPREWQDHLVWARNDIAHEGAPDSLAGDRFVTDEESRAVRDATRVLVSLTIAKAIGVPNSVLDRAAERFGVRYGPRHWSTTIFRR